MIDFWPKSNWNNFQPKIIIYKLLEKKIRWSYFVLKFQILPVCDQYFLNTNKFYGLVTKEKFNWFVIKIKKYQFFIRIKRDRYWIKIKFRLIFNQNQNRYTFNQFFSFVNDIFFLSKSKRFYSTPESNVIDFWSKQKVIDYSWKLNLTNFRPNSLTKIVMNRFSNALKGLSTLLYPHRISSVIFRLDQFSADYFQ